MKNIDADADGFDHSQAKPPTPHLQERSHLLLHRKELRLRLLCVEQHADRSEGIHLIGGKPCRSRARSEFGIIDFDALGLLFGSRSRDAPSFAGNPAFS